MLFPDQILNTCPTLTPVRGIDKRITAAFFGCNGEFFGTADMCKYINTVGQKVDQGLCKCFVRLFIFFAHAEVFVYICKTSRGNALMFRFVIFGRRIGYIIAGIVVDHIYRGK